MGKAFAFANKEFVAQNLPSLDPTRHHLFCLLNQATRIEHYRLPKLPLPPRPCLLVATCDKELYYEGRDSVNLLFFDPIGAGKTLAVKLRAGNLEVSRHSVTLGSRGEGALTVGLLPVGDYQVTVEDEKLCSFTVASYSMAPLVGTLLRLEKETDDLVRATINVATFGRPLEGPVWVTLRCARGKKRRAYALAQNGILQARLELTGMGPFYIDLHHAQDTELTATVPLPGTSEKERKSVPLSGFSPQISASMIGSAKSEEVRGLYLTSADTSRPGPFQFERLEGSRARLTPNQALSPVVVAVIDPIRADETRVYQWDSVEPGQALTFDMPSPMGVVAVGTYYQDRPWEGWAVTFSSSELTCSIHHPDSIEAGETVSIEMETSSDCALYVLVKDARLACRERPNDRLASRLLDGARDMRAEGWTGHVCHPTHTEYRAKYLERLLSTLDIDESVRNKAMQAALWTGCAPLDALRGVLNLTVPEFYKRYLGMELTRFDNADPELARLIPEDLARRYRCIPLDQTDANILILGMVDPLDGIATDDIELITGFKVQPILMDEEWVRRMINLNYGVTDLVEVEETVKDISAQDFGNMNFEDDLDEDIALDMLKHNSSPRLVVVEDVPEEPEKSQDADVFHAAWIEVKDGKATLELKTPDQPTEIVIEAFAADGLDWTFTKAQFATDKPLFFTLDCPPFVHPRDEVEGRLRVVAGQPPFRLSLQRDGVALAMPEVLESRKPVTFACLPGHYVAIIEEITTGRLEKLEATVEQAGRISGLRKTVEWLRTGDKLDRTLEPGIFELRTLDSVERPARRLYQTTANYSHLCCEQTASKILAAVMSWLSSPSDEMESIVRAGIEREKTMYLPGRGFAAYPNYREPNVHWGEKAAITLCQLGLLRTTTMPESFGALLDEGASMGLDVLRAGGKAWPPTDRESAQSCYLEYSYAEQDPAIVKMAMTGFKPLSWGRVGERTSRCYQAAILLRAGQAEGLAAELVNNVLRDIREDGALYSTMDSIAAAVLFKELQECGPSWAQPELVYDGTELLSAHAVDGDALVEVTRAFVNDWSLLESTMEIDASLEPSELDAGSTTQLKISVPTGYKDGDLVWVSLPKSLARIQGGGQVRQFSVDFEGKSSLTVDLVALSPTKGEGETVLVCLRNMYIEERVALPDLLRVQVQAPSVTKAVGIKLASALLEADLTSGGLQGVPRTMSQIQTISGLVHHPDLIDCLEQLVLKATEEDSRCLTLDWAESGVARCRLMTPTGLIEAGRYPAQLQIALVGRLQMLTGNVLGPTGAQEGEARIGERLIPVSMLPTSLGMTATLELKERPKSELTWVRALSDLQQALAEGYEPDLPTLRGCRPTEDNRLIDDLFEVIGADPIPRDRALELLAHLAVVVVAES